MNEATAYLSQTERDAQTIRGLRVENAALLAANLDCMAHYNELRAALDTANRGLECYRTQLEKDTVQSDLDTIMAQGIEIAELRVELAGQTKAADHWMGEACRDHNELDRLKQQEPVGVVGDNGHLWAPAGKSYNLGDKLYLAAGAQPVQEPITDAEILALAHKTATTYAHRSDPKYHSYAFLPHTLIAFVRAVAGAQPNHIASAGKMVQAGWFRKVPSATSHSIWEQSGLNWKKGDVALYVRGES